MRWLQGLGATDRDALERLSGTLVDAVLDELGAASRARRERAHDEASLAATRLAAVVTALGGDLVEALGLFLRFRSILVQALGESAVRQGLDAAEATALLHRAGEAADRLAGVFVAGLTEPPAPTGIGPDTR